MNIDTMKPAFTLLFSLMMASTNAQTEIPLYKGKIPKSKDCNTENKTQVNQWGQEVYTKVNNPTLTIYTPAASNRNQTAVLILPGGGYTILAANHEGQDIAKAFNGIGVNAFVLKYRLPNDTCMFNKEWVPFIDAQTAMKWIRDHASEYGINPDKIGVIGFSAGGHLASTLATQYQLNLNDQGSRTNARPNFAILGYPVISMEDAIGHAGSRIKLIGKDAVAATRDQFSSHLQVSRFTPPTFLFHAKDDTTVPVENSLQMKAALDAQKIPAELLLMEKGGHGFGLNNKQEPTDWFKSLQVWMKEQGFL